MAAKGVKKALPAGMLNPKFLRALEQGKFTGDSDQDKIILSTLKNLDPTAIPAFLASVTAPGGLEATVKGLTDLPRQVATGNHEAMAEMAGFGLSLPLGMLMNKVPGITSKVSKPGFTSRKSVGGSTTTLSKTKQTQSRSQLNTRISHSELRKDLSGDLLLSALNNSVRRVKVGGKDLASPAALDYHPEGGRLDDGAFRRGPLRQVGNSMGARKRSRPIGVDRHYEEIQSTRSGKYGMLHAIEAEMRQGTAFRDPVAYRMAISFVEALDDDLLDGVWLRFKDSVSVGDGEPIQGFYDLVGQVISVSREYRAQVKTNWRGKEIVVNRQSVAKR